MHQTLTVTQINEYIRGKMEQDVILNNVVIQGEISNYKVYPSGHHYFTLKDEGAALKCVMFKGSAIRLRFRPDNGMKVIQFIPETALISCIVPIWSWMVSGIYMLLLSS